MIVVNCAIHKPFVVFASAAACATEVFKIATRSGAENKRVLICQMNITKHLFFCFVLQCVYTFK